MFGAPVPVRVLIFTAVAVAAFALLLWRVARMIARQRALAARVDELDAELLQVQRKHRRLAARLDALDFAPPGRLVTAPTAIATVIADAVRAAGDGPPPVQLGLADDLPPVVIDAARVGQALGHLIDNARRHGRGATWIRIAAWREGDRVKLTVDNDGAPIAADVLSRVLEPFFATGARAGLGLAIAHRVCVAHGGALTASIAPGDVTRFAIELPIGGPPDAKAA